MSYADDAGAAAKAAPNRPDGPMSLLHKLRAMPGGNILIAFLAIEFFCVLGALLFPNQFRYLSSANIAVTLEAIPTVGFISLGVGLLMIAGEFDLSVGSVYTFSSIIAATLLDNYRNPRLDRPCGRGRPGRRHRPRQRADHDPISRCRPSSSRSAPCCSGAA